MYAKSVNCAEVTQSEVTDNSDADAETAVVDVAHGPAHHGSRAGDGVEDEELLGEAGGHSLQLAMHLDG